MSRRSILFVVLVLAFNINLRQVSSHDTYASRFVPLSLVRDGDLVLDEFVPDAIRQQAGDDFFSDYFFYARGHFYDSHPPVGPLLAVPVYALPAWIGIPARPELAANLLSKIAASIMVALSALAVFAASLRTLTALRDVAGVPELTPEARERVALLAAFAYGLGTSVWSTSSLALWSHTPAVLGYAVALWALLSRRFVLAGAAGAVAVIARQATAPALGLLALFVVHRWWHRARTPDRSGEREALQEMLRFGIVAALVGAAGLLYNFWLFGNAVGGAPFRTGYWLRELGATSMFAGSISVGLPGLLISPGRGILIFSPVVLVGVAGAVRAWRLSARPAGGDDMARHDALLLSRYASLAALVILLTYSKFIAWWGGHGFGPRYLTDAMPFVGLLMSLGFAPLAAAVHRVPFARLAAATVLSYSIFIQALGAFCWPSPWTTSNNPPYRFRLWDWHDSEIHSCLRHGPKFDPFAQRVFNRLGF